MFDLLVLAGRNVMHEPLERRRELLQDKILPKLREPIRHSPELKAELPNLIDSVKAQGLEGLIAKPRQHLRARAAFWRLARKMPVNQEQRRRGGFPTENICSMQ